jgi:hypothetical protein
LTLKVGDIVMVIGADSPRQPQPGAVGTVHAACPCMVSVRLEGYMVRFDERRGSCYFRRQLRKLDPPADADETETDNKYLRPAPVKWFLPA